MNDQLTLERWRAELEKELKSNILGFWMKHTIDERNGGFVGEIGSDMSIKPDADKGLVLNARILWTFATAYRVYQDEAYRTIADRAYEELGQRFRDRKHGGLYWIVDAFGHPVQDKKQVYGQAFVIYALSEYFRATGSEEALSWAKELYRLIEKHAWDSVHRGYIEALAGDWTETNDLSLSGKDLNERKSMNTHLHVLEAYTNLYRAWKPEGLRMKLAELIDIHLELIVDSNNNHFKLFFDDEWNSKTEQVSYGHDIEGSWLLCEAAEVLGDDARIRKVNEAAYAMAEATLAEGTDSDGGIYNEADGKGHIDDSKDWWPQAEAMVGFLNAYQLSGNEAMLRAAMKSWSFTKTFIIDDENGEWHWQVSRDGVPNRSYAKVDRWKCPYHNSRACFEGLERLAHLIQRRNHS
ncbi:AGE family epimerase/isomerase [Cohnella herbarum]|uniref:Cellobiose 2-epimerase n=1 Tax=Cohnella herbarum TaxID=2728023 RepID=A0A7Z2VF42_9BACL|nr:AGE family epimerase/isomerase [Cohnella herbarum]QJD82046.1 N-acyl-D-glucosamine 2-epimerase [Cohnella herbarum]